MKKLVFSFFTLFVVIGLQAQITMTYETHVLLPETENDMVITGYQDPGPSGENVVWDFSGLTNEKNFTGFINLSENAEFTLANTELNENGNLFYFDVNQNRMVELGQTNKSGSYNITYTEAPVKISYPFTYESFENGNYSGTYQAGNTSGDIQGTYTVEADGYGTLKLPNGVIANDVLRVKSVKSYTRTIGSSISEITTETYRWYNAAERYPLLVLIKTTNKCGNNNPCISHTAAYKTEFEVPAVEKSSELTKTPVADVTVYPNPTSAELTISYTVAEEAHVKITLVDISGKTINTLVDAKQAAGNKEINTNISRLVMHPGTYMLKTNIGNYSHTETIMIEK